MGMNRAAFVRVPRGGPAHTRSEPKGSPCPPLLLSHLQPCPALPPGQVTALGRTRVRGSGLGQPLPSSEEEAGAGGCCWDPSDFQEWKRNHGAARSLAHGHVLWHP